MKIVVVQPKIGYMDAMRSSPGPPLGLLSAASKLVGHYDLELIDARLTDDLEGSLARALTPDTLFVGVTCHTGPMIHSALHISRFVKSNSDIPVVWGGVHPSVAPEQTIADPAVDVCVIGEGEQTALELARALEQGRALDSVPGLALWRDGAAVRTADRKLLPPEQWSMPAYDLVDLSRYLPLYDGRPSLFYQASRGCPYECGFCYNVPFNRRRYRKLDPDVVVSSLRRLRQQLNFEDVYFVDDNFFVDLQWSEQVARGVAEMGLSWQVQGVDIRALLRMDRDSVRRLRELGCRRLTIGVETGSPRMREQIHKYGTRDDVIRAIENLAGADILVFTSFMVGLPGETVDEMRVTVDLALELIDRFDFVRCSPFYCYSPWPGTESFAAAIKDGFRPPKTLEQWADIGGMDAFTWERDAGGRILGRSFFEGLNLASLFIDHKLNEYSGSKLLSILADLYRPIARFRTRKMFFGLMPERWFLNRYFDRLT